MQLMRKDLFKVLPPDLLRESLAFLFEFLEEILHGTTGVVPLSAGSEYLSVAIMGVRFFHRAEHETAVFHLSQFLRVEFLQDSVEQFSRS